MHTLRIGRVKICQLTDEEARRVDMLEQLEPCDLLSIQEVAGRLDISVRTVYKYIKEERIKAVKIGRMWRIPVAVYLDFVYGKANEQLRKNMAAINKLEEQLDLIHRN